MSEESASELKTFLWDASLISWKTRRLAFGDMKSNLKKLNIQLRVGRNGIIIIVILGIVGEDKVTPECCWSGGEGGSDGTVVEKELRSLGERK